MSSSIEEIIALDKAARNRVAVAAEEAGRINAEAAAEMEALEAQTRAAAEEKTKSICGEIRAKADEEAALIEKKSGEKRRRLDRVMSENAEAWRKAIIQRIIG